MARQSTVSRALGRYWSKVEKTETCWLWRGSLDKDGYGVFSIGYTKYRTARFAYRLFYGKLDATLEVDHICRVRSCVNPEHLRLVTHAINQSNNTHSLTTHCPHGHPYNASNTLRTTNGHRICKVCAYARNRRHWHQKYCKCHAH